MEAPLTPPYSAGLTMRPPHVPAPVFSQAPPTRNSTELDPARPPWQRGARGVRLIPRPGRPLPTPAAIPVVYGARTENPLLSLPSPLLCCSYLMLRPASHALPVHPPCIAPLILDQHSFVYVLVPSNVPELEPSLMRVQLCNDVNV